MRYRICTSARRHVYTPLPCSVTLCATIGLCRPESAVLMCSIMTGPRLPAADSWRGGTSAGSAGGAKLVGLTLSHPLRRTSAS